MAGPSGIKRGIPDIHGEDFDMSRKKSKMSGDSTELEDNTKRWNSIGTILHTILAPALRKYVEPRLHQLWLTLKSSHNIDIQGYPNHLKSYGYSPLNYASINNNRFLSGHQLPQYNFHVINSVELSKLFLQPHIAKFSSFDEDCDLSALFGIIINTGICTAIGQESAKKIKEIRNVWSHGDQRTWTVAKYTESLYLMESFIRKLGFTNEEEAQIIAQLDKFRLNESYPEAIKRMDVISRELYKKALESGVETKKEIRVLVVGKKGAGKTSLIRRLRAKPIDDVTDTNGIEIHSVICKDDNDILWNETTQTADSRLRTCTKNLVEKNPSMENKGQEVIYDISGSKETDDKVPQENQRSSKIDKQHIQQEQSALGSDDIETDIHLKNEENFDQDIEDMTKAEENDKGDIRLSVWDFGGDVEFYYTHQLFLAENAVFLIVTSLEDSDVYSDIELNFWFETIHCLGTEPEGHALKPRCIVIGTKKDLQPDDETADRVFGKKLQSVPETLRNHIYGQGILISNKEAYDETIKSIKTAIVNAAKESTNWETEHPVKFILLDKALDKQRQKLEKKPVITHGEIISINEGLHQPLIDDELDLYLRYNHLAGHLIYYEGISDYIVIDPQWLSDLFRCIVTADKFRHTKLPKHDLTKLRSTGILTETLLKDIFEIKNVEVELQPYLFKLMEKFHIVISHSLEDGAKMYFAPCMVRDMLFDARQTAKDKSTCLCLECNFLPPFIFNHIVISFCEKYLRPNALPMFYSNGAMFDISPNKLEKLVILKFENAIQLQIMIFGQKKGQQYSEIKSFLIQKMAEVTQNYFMTIKYEYRWKCPESLNTCSGLLEFNACREGEEYYCETCTEPHIFQNYWDENKQQSTLSKEELNFTRLAMLVTEVLTDALYDLLPIPKPMTRNQCDVTSLYQTHRNQKKNNHTPSSGRWGGVKTVNDVPANSIQVGDDIERCRVIRNGLNHSPHYAIPDNEFDDRYRLIHEIVTRLYTFMGLSSTPTYMDRAEEIKQKTYGVSDREEIKEKLDRELNVHNYNAENISVVHHHHYK